MTIRKDRRRERYADERGTKFDKVLVTIADATRLLEQRGDERRPMTTDALRAGLRVDA